MESLEQSVDQFLEYFRERIAEIKAVSFGPATKLFKKILYVGILDALSKTVSYPKQGNRDRFVSLIRHFGKWKHGEKVSLPHLARLLQKVHNPEFTKIRAYAYEQFDKWPRDTLVDLDADLYFDEVKKSGTCQWNETLPI